MRVKSKYRKRLDKDFWEYLGPRFPPLTNKAESPKIRQSLSPTFSYLEFQEQSLWVYLHPEENNYPRSGYTLKHLKRNKISTSLTKRMMGVITA